MQNTIKAKYIAINTIIKKAVYIKALLKELGFYN
jgi:hypothetical protein